MGVQATPTKEIHMEKQYGDYHGDEDEIESDKQEKEDNDPRHEPGHDY
tara:strand:+ start:13 stop:156 length:144 start_codon:yes stop_codon:yes gene_type:complete